MLNDAQDEDALALDFESVRHRLQKLATQAFPAWTDHNSVSFGNVLLDLFAYVTEVLGYYIEHQGREARLVTVTQRVNAIAHGRSLGYRPRGATAARAVLKFTLEEVTNTDVEIPRGYIARTQDVAPSIRFRLLDATQIVAGSAITEALAEASTLRSSSFDATGTPDQRYVLPVGPYIDGSVRVISPSYGEFNEVGNFLDSSRNDRHFEVIVDENERATLQFGDGILGVAPSGRLDVTYATGGGAQSNVEAGSINVAESPVFNADGKPVRIQVTNANAAEGGEDRESVESIRLNTIQNLRVAQRTITREDFEINARKVPGVARALMLTAGQDEGIEENTGRLYIVPNGGGGLNDELKTRVLRQVTHEYPCTLTFQVDVLAPTYVPVHIEAKIDLVDRGYGASNDARWETAVCADATSRIRDLFSVSNKDGSPNERTNFGFYLRGANQAPGEIAWSDVVSTLCGTPGVRKAVQVTLNGRTEDVRLLNYDFPTAGQIRVTPWKPGT